MRNFAKAKQKNCAKGFFEKSKIEGDDLLKNHLICCWKYPWWGFLDIHIGLGLSWAITSVSSSTSLSCHSAGSRSTP